MKIQKLEEKIIFPEGVNGSIKDGDLTLKGPKGELTRRFYNKKISLVLNGNELVLLSENATKKEKNLVFTFKAHINNMIKGVTKGYVYKLKICSGHFPMNVSLKGSSFEVKNFIGEKVPRTVELKEGSKVNIQGELIVVEGIDKELVSQTAATIEKLTRRPGFDNRIFQDGIYIIEKDGKVL